MNTLEKAANVAVIGLCVVVAGEIGYRHLGRSPGRSVGGAPQSVAPGEYQVGEKIDGIPGYRAEPGKKVLLVVVKSTCGFCKSSMVFYRELGASVRRASAPVRLVGVCLEPPDACARFFKTYDVGMDVVVGVESNVMKVRGTPTLILADDLGIVRSVWKGALAPAAERAVIRAITGASAPGD
jgi:hypothetical protein